VDHRDHVDLLRRGVRDCGPRWADLGSGTGAFTLALADLLGPAGEIWSVDRDAGALREQHRHMAEQFPVAAVRYIVADFARPLDLPPLDGFVIANALHFERDQAAVLARLVTHLVPGGRVILVEYDADHGNQWVPHPISLARWRGLAAAAGLVDVREIGRRPSRFLGSIYAAAAARPGTADGLDPRSANSGVPAVVEDAGVTHARAGAIRLSSGDAWGTDPAVTYDLRGRLGLATAEEGVHS